MEINKASLTEGSFLHSFATINFLHFCIFMFVACVGICVVVSLLTPAPSEEKIRGLTFSTITPEQRASNRASYSKWDIVLSAFVVLCIVGIMCYFTG